MPTPHHDSAATRARLVQAAEELYSTLGFLRTTTPMLAERAGIAEGTIYRHFTGKEQLLDEVCRQSYDWAIELLGALEGDRVRRAPERMASLAQSLVAAAGHHPARVRLLTRDDHLGLLGKVALDRRRIFHERLSHLVATGKADGLVRTGPAELWASVWFVVVRHLVDQVATGNWEVNSPMIPLAIDAAWCAIAARGSA
ncbi:MAG: TetR/AcrR family transcriptional regulator [Gemmatimonadota bacterium]|nr:TetR/AcrR family transcriptional regulator [Gemmatimonadota bacterium]